MLNLRAYWLFALLMLFALPKPAQAQWELMNDDAAVPAGKRSSNMVGDDQPVTNADLDQAAKGVKKRVVATPHPTEVARSLQAYNRGRFAEAVTVLAPLARQEPADPSVLDQYARSLYQLDAKDRSYAAYQRLLMLLDNYGRENSSTCVVYLPFCEAYFKMATLQMDHHQWAQAAYNLSRFQMAIGSVPDWKSDGIYEQALQYQTECFAELKNEQMCRHFGQRTLKFFPHNQYVRPYLAKVGQKAAPAKR